jgi:hypothetical protein
MSEKSCAGRFETNPPMHSSFLKMAAFAIFGILMSNAPASADWNASLSPSLRSFPRGTNITAELGYDFRLWGSQSYDISQRGQDSQNEIGRDETQSYHYGYLRLRSAVDASGTLTAAVQLVPIAFVQIEAAQSYTDRWAKHSFLDCEIINECRNWVKRTDLSLKFAAAWQSLQFVGKLLTRDLETATGSRPVALEFENFSVPSGASSVREASVYFGKKFDRLSVGYLGLLTAIPAGAHEARSHYLLARFRWLDANWAAGLGSYESDIKPIGMSVVTTATWSWGQSLALF